MSNIPENILKTIQDCVSLIPVIVIGSGASCQYGISGMDKLAEYLVENITPEAKNQNVWDDFKREISSGIDLENALHKIALPDILEREIIDKSRELVLSEDVKVLEQTINKKIDFPLSALLKHLVRTANPVIKIVTTNYDRIVEYAIDRACLTFNDGFKGQYIKYFSGFNTQKQKTGSYSIDLLKVHGSVDWFLDEDSNAVSLLDNTKFYNNNYSPLIVTPGERKYKHTYNEPFRSIITESDSAFENARSILCIGYGFKDIHIQPKLSKRLKTGKMRMVIITKKLSENALKFIKETTYDSVIGIDENSTGSRIVTATAAEDIIIDAHFWQLSDILKLLI